jgi:hypothetical protein
MPDKFNDQEQEDFLNTDDNERPQDSNNSDAGKFTEDAEEQAMLETRDTDNEQTTVTDHSMEEPGSHPLTTQGNAEELENNLGGTSNLSLDQLKKLHHPGE